MVSIRSKFRGEIFQLMGQGTVIGFISPPQPELGVAARCAATPKSLVRRNPVGLQAVFGLIRFSVGDPKLSVYSTNEESICDLWALI